MEDQYADIIGIIKESAPVAPPDDFTRKVMARLAAEQSIWSKAKQALFNPAGAPVQSPRARMLPLSDTRECPFYFFITGFFYLIMGVVLLAGFKANSSSMTELELIKLQPHLTIAAAMWLLALGMVLMKEGSNAIKIARNGTLIYVVFSLLNGILMRQYLHVSYADMFIIGFVATSVLMGVILVLAVKKMEMRSV